MEVAAAMVNADEEERARANLAMQLKKVLDTWPTEVEVIKFKAKVCKARYDALRKEGFDVASALSLCTKDIQL